MAEQGNQQKMVGIFKDLGIDYTVWMDNPSAFARTLRDAAMKLDVQLKEKNSILNLEERFKSKALSNKVAQEQAEEFIQSIFDQIMGMDIDTMVCVLTKLPEISHSMAVTIRNQSMRQERSFSKRRIHLMYSKLRKAYEIYIGFMMAFKPEDLMKDGKTPPMIPARPGNYNSDSLGIKEYLFTIDGDDYLNYYTAARILEIDIVSYMDLVDALNGKSKWNGHSVAVTLLGEDDGE